MPDTLKKIIEGDKNATYNFYKKYSTRIFIYLQKHLPSNEDAQEIMQDVFLEAIDSIVFFKEKSSVLTWLYKIAHNKLVDYYRKRKIKTIVFSQIPFLKHARDEMYEPEFQYEKNIIRDKIEKAFNMLAFRHKNILYMHYEKGMRIKEIAKQLDISFKATESLLFRARQCFIKAYERT